MRDLSLKINSLTSSDDEKNGSFRQFRHSATDSSSAVLVSSSISTVIWFGLGLIRLAIGFSPLRYKSLYIATDEPHSSASRAPAEEDAQSLHRMTAARALSDCLPGIRISQMRIDVFHLIWCHR
jgi:hypothetical protein